MYISKPLHLEKKKIKNQQEKNCQKSPPPELIGCPQNKPGNKRTKL
jgi:hypothetical protein